jgi:phosphoglycerate dehydrogenase-like enzyme
VKVAFLDPLEARLAEFPKTYLREHDVLVSTAAGEPPAGYKDAEAVVWWTHPVDGAFLGRMPRLRFVQKVGIMRGKGDATAALAKGIPVSQIPFGVSDRVALHAMSLTLALLRKLLPGHRAVLAGTNPDNLPEVEAGGAAQVNWARVPDVDTLNDKTVGILGFGEIGACYARMLAPYDTRTLYYKRTPLSAHQARYFGVEYASMEDVLRQSDVLLSFVPYSEESRKMLGARELALLKPSALFVNCGRGPTVDEVALYEALRDGRIAGAGLDVFFVEPLPAESPLRELDNVILEPHSAGGTPGWQNTFERIAENLRRVEAGRTVIQPLRQGDPQPGVPS